ncbi:MAG: hypothetical protein N5P05_004302 (plasmid) [Chroococcopsis gigantea SAG 12.99]|jgi:hypothetical protein|nr:hypothetical protein [Chroococcopsis gigantea SAG 12.99]
MTTDINQPAVPTIELYMYSLNQEFPKDRGHHSFLKRFTETKPDISKNLKEASQIESQVFNPDNSQIPDWPTGQWHANQWNENHTKSTGVGIREESDPLARSLLREEKFGGILFEPISDRVFKLNSPGYELFSEIREYYFENKDLLLFVSHRFSEQDIKSFLAFLKGAGIWIHN